MRHQRAVSSGGFFVMRKHKRTHPRKQQRKHHRKRSKPCKMRLSKGWRNTRGNTGEHICGNADGTQTRSKEINNVVVNVIQ